MPQLNPNPWLFTMLIAWLTLSMILQPKLLSFITTNLPTHKTQTAIKTTPWTWPWT
uniref:ATP synthase complex subunit 8 n=3 Tax=Strigidae TaxID=30459 RepID=A0A411NGY3_9STRI|nr:ATP synthase F0 subunit 8 [Otus scops]YP_009573012.1 ATP synthase F0 subunit 8 [Otus sunia]ATN41084.1 ATP synthase F0 subunit 8 [Glaucidium brodiei]ALH07265.1 ATP synthase F0 subunit 8 [Otus scops]ARV78444.1 ATP synthase F0 subunit 8 [Otus scops]QBF43952.1 ATP synthase F0 subunit 8 [Otus sunia]QLI52317.1 ATP synthase F0 subunit 8 [Otus sunia]